MLDIWMTCLFTADFSGALIGYFNVDRIYLFIYLFLQWWELNPGPRHARQAFWL
jgi:hypothetical protein